MDAGTGSPLASVMVVENQAIGMSKIWLEVTDNYYFKLVVLGITTLCNPKYFSKVHSQCLVRVVSHLALCHMGKGGMLNAGVRKLLRSSDLFENRDFPSQAA